jgi:hypothetical protein
VYIISLIYILFELYSPSQNIGLSPRLFVVLGWALDPTNHAIFFFFYNMMMMMIMMNFSPLRNLHCNSFGSRRLLTCSRSFGSLAHIPKLYTFSSLVPRPHALVSLPVQSSNFSLINKISLLLVTVFFTLALR